MASTTLVVHGRPDLVYASPADWIAWDCQAHWNKGGGRPDPNHQPPNTLVPNTAHTHVVPHAPLLAELSTPITIPIDFKLFHCAGKLAPPDYVWCFFATQAGQVHVPVIMDTPGPYVGDPEGLVTFKAHVEIDPALGSKHGWFSVYIGCRTFFDTGATTDCNCALNFFSMVDPSVPEPIYGEDTATLTAKGTVVAPDHPQVFQATVMRTADLLTDPKATVTLIEMCLKGFSKPMMLGTASYNYGADPHFPEGGYQVIVNPDLHMGIPGTPLNIVKSSPVAGGSSNQDLLDPAVLASFPPPMGLTEHQRRLMFVWFVSTGNGFTDQNGNHIPAGEDFRILFTVVVTVGADVTPSPQPDPMPMPDPAPTPVPPTPTPTPTPTPMPDDDGPIKGTIHKRPDGTICVCATSLDAFVETNKDGFLCLVLG